MPPLGRVSTFPCPLQQELRSLLFVKEHHEFDCACLWAAPKRRAHQTGHLHGHCQASSAAIPFSENATQIEKLIAGKARGIIVLYY